jgi:hypothetical protein
MKCKQKITIGRSSITIYRKIMMTAKWKFINFKLITKISKKWLKKIRKCIMNKWKSGELESKKCRKMQNWKLKASTSRLWQSSVSLKVDATNFKSALLLRRNFLIKKDKLQQWGKNKKINNVEYINCNNYSNNRMKKLLPIQLVLNTSKTSYPNRSS